MGPVEALQLALVKEREAQQMYQEFAVKFSAARETFEFLAGEEQKHALLIEKKISVLAR